MAQHNWAKLDPCLRQLAADGFTQKQAAQNLGMTTSTLENHLKTLEKGGTPIHFKGQRGSYARRTEMAVHPPVQSTDTDAETSAEQRAVQPPVQTFESRVDDRAETGAVNYIPVQTAVQKLDTGAVQTFDTGAVQRIDQLEGDVRHLAEMMRSVMDRLNELPVQTPVQITALPPYPKGRSVRWNIWILDAIQDELKILAAERDISPSQLVQEMLWNALRRE